MTHDPNQYEGHDLEAMSAAPHYHEWILSNFRPFITGDVIEVGAGSGNFSSLLLKEKIRSLVALEPSHQMYPLLAERLANNPNASYEQDTFKNFISKRPVSFDSIVYVNVLEHIENDQEELSLMYQALKPGGQICIFVPALPMLFSQHDKTVGHFRRYTKPDMRRKLMSAGFSITKLTYFDIAGILPWLIFMKLFGQPVSSGSAALYDNVVVLPMRVVESVVPLPFGKNLLVVGKKPSV